MLTPPYHFSIVSSPQTTPTIQQQHDDDDDDENECNPELLYRGSIPVIRNLSFLKRLNLRTIIYLRKKELAGDDVLRRWSKKRDIELKWIKADKMEEEKLGMGKSEVGEVLKTILNPASYPLYIADNDGISHTTLIVACLRKLQGWHMDSIINEVSRFEPEHEDLPLASFISTYLTGPSSSSDPAFTLPVPPYPTWLWPTTNNVSPPLTRTTTRDRSTSMVAPAPPSFLPFPHPPTARRHPTMKIAFPPITNSITSAAPPSVASALMPPPPAPLMKPNASQERYVVQNSVSKAGSGSMYDVSPQLSATAQSPSQGGLSRVNSIRSTTSDLPPGLTSPTGVTLAGGGIVGAAANLISAGLTSLSGHNPNQASAKPEKDSREERSKRFSRNVSFEQQLPNVRPLSSTGGSVADSGNETPPRHPGSTAPSITTSPRKTGSSATDAYPDILDSGSGVMSPSDTDATLSDLEAEQQYVQEPEEEEAGSPDDEDDDEEYEDEEEEEEEEEDLQPTSQYISALDLANF